MIAVSAADMRAMDKTVIRRIFHGDGFPLMKIAAAKVSDRIIQLFKSHSSFRKVIILTGKGNNGGDGFVIAHNLYQVLPVELHCIFGENDLSGDALSAFRCIPAPLAKKISYTLSPDDLTRDCLIVDAMLGTGFHGELRPPFDQWINTVNHSGCSVLSVDIPSGIDPDTGIVSSDAVRADWTVTFAAPKKGMLFNDAPGYCGRIFTEDIGIPEEILQTAQDPILCTGPSDTAAMFRKDPWDTFKNKRGHVLILGGSSAYPSAPFLAGEAALRAGAGLVTVAIPEHTEVFCTVPKALIVRRLPDNGAGVFTEDSVEALLSGLNSYTSIAVGPGMNHDTRSAKFLKTVLNSIDCPVVIDADALNLIASHPEIAGHWKPDRIVTPHEGEMKRLLCSFGYVPDTGSRMERAGFLAKTMNVHTVLKGARTVTVTPDGQCAVNLSGSPNLATAGSGDVLTGIIAAFCCRTQSVDQAVKAGVFVHGYAGELANRGMIADDLPQLAAKAIDNLMYGTY